ncbi:MAG: PqqD family protein [Chloroflexaceae bacterium]|nr:PqqD family protein [Chloroflexaceae bacterium]NJO06340.1 PqqD family protein [Chloroflexaceae bacterium]
MIAPDSRPRRAADAIERLVQDEMVLLLPGRGEVKVLNNVGTLIWTLCDGGHTVREIVQQVCTEYETTPTEAERDTLAFLHELVRRRLVMIGQT